MGGVATAGKCLALRALTRQCPRSDGRHRLALQDRVDRGGPGAVRRGAVAELAGRVALLLDGGETGSARQNALLEAGADIHESEPKYRSNALHLAANRSTNVKVIEALLEAGADLNARNYLGETALIIAVNTNPETRIVSALLKAGADFNARDYQGHSVQEYACEAKRTYIVTQLRKLGAQ